MDPKKNNYPLIHYLIQGRSIENDNNYIEQSFIESNPLEARKRAFLYLEYYVQLLHHGKKIFFQEKNKIIDDTILLEDINNYDISFAENNFGLDGIAVYMVVNYRTKEQNKIVENNEERHLIYSIKNLSEKNVETIKHALIKEFEYYYKLKIVTTNHQDGLTLLNSPESNGIAGKTIYKIIKTPTNFYFKDFKTYESELFREDVAQDFKVIDLQKATFISNLDWHIVNIHIASFINTNGGKIYLGKVYKNQIINCIDEVSIAKCTQLLKKNILPNFPKQNCLISFQFVKINKVLVPVIEIRVSDGIFSFYNNLKKNNFYYRTKKGIQTINDTEKIAEYIIKNSDFRISDLNEILDFL